jgi:hypothetical protein
VRALFRALFRAPYVGSNAAGGDFLLSARKSVVNRIGSEKPFLRT